MFLESDFYQTLIVIFFGLLVGSFLNVVIHRLPLGESVVKPRSHCPDCGHSFPWYLNVPVMSYLFLLGKCFQCRKPISIRYPLVELLTALLFLAAKIRFGFSGLLFLKDFPLISILIAVTFIDLRHRIIPDSLSIGGLVLGLVASFFDPELGWDGALIGAVCGFGFFYGIAWFYVWRTGSMGLGGGDIKLLAMIGAYMGIKGVVTTIFLSSILGSIFGIILALRQKRQNPSSDTASEQPEGILKFSIPYGPFLVIGALYYYLLGEIVWNPLMHLY
jgi:leader peptidase (prepilin peptidase) / N-methyltransferase